MRNTILLAGALLFTVLLALFTIELDYTGKATTSAKVNITPSDPANCSLIGRPGMNTISFPCISTGQPRTDVFTNDTGVVAMYRYIPGSPDPWQVHNPGLPGYVVSDLTILSRATGYVLLMNTTRNISFEGFTVPFTNVPMSTGWNLVGYPSLAVENASDSFSNIDNFTEARTVNSSSQIFLIYLNPGGGTLTQTVPGQGYWINATQPLNWVVS